MCICENVKPDPLMLKCDHCGREEHAACYRILQEDHLPARHCCAPCGQEEGRACTDPKTGKMFKNHQRNSAPTCLFRRVLAALAQRCAWTPKFGVCSEFGVFVEITPKIRSF
jgi:hypothetical protein